MCAKKKKVMIYDHDEWLEPYKEVIDRRQKMILDLKDRFSVGGSLANGLNNHMYYGLHRNGQGNWVFREWAPNATKIYLIGEFNNWKRTEAYALKPLGGGNWQISRRWILSNFCENFAKMADRIRHLLSVVVCCFRFSKKH